MENPFEQLGLPVRFDLEASEIEQRYRELQRTVHPDKHTADGVRERRAALASSVDVTQAYRTLRDDVLRAEALLVALGRGEQLAATEAEPELLAEVMALRESLHDARVAGDARRVEELRARVVASRDTTRAELSVAFLVGDLDGAPSLVNRMRYYRRFLEALASFEDEETHLGPR